MINNKIAICFFGLLRTNPIVAPSIKENLIEALNADLFICCPNIFWGIKTEEHQRAKNSRELVGPEYLENTYGKRLKSYKIIPYNMQIFKDLIKEKGLPEQTKLIVCEGQPDQWEWCGDNYRSLSMFYQIKTGLGLIEQFENKHNFKYSTVILMRPDLQINNKADISSLDLNKVYSTGNHCAPVFGTGQRIGDHLLTSKRDNIMVIKDLYDNIQAMYKDGVAINNESMIGHHLIRNNIKFEHNYFLDHIIDRGDVP